MASLIQAELAHGGHGPTFVELWNRMELDFELARAHATPVALARLAVERFERLPAARRAPVLAAIGALVAQRLPRAEGCAVLRGDEVVVLLPGSNAAEIEGFARGLIQAARKLEIQGEAAPLRVALAAGVAVTRAGIDGYFETLFDVAGEGLDVARNAGGDSCVHSELYELVQRRIERVKGPRKPIPPPAPVPAPAPLLAAQPPRPAPAIAAQDSAARAPSVLRALPANGHAAPPAAQRETEARPQPRGLPRPETIEVEARVRELLPSVGASNAIDMASLENKVLEIARAAFERALAERAEKFKSEIELYERRIAKMQNALDRAESHRGSGSRAAEVDTGVASVYRDVQGLNGDEPDYSRRSGLLAQIAESNRALFEELRRASA